jgi:hypothetical protein
MKKSGAYIVSLLVSLLVLCLHSCKKDSKDTTNNIVLGYDYYPLKTGSYIIYNVEEITIDAAVGKFDTLRYQLKELLADTIFSTDSTIKRYKIDRFIRLDSTLAWDVKNVWQVIQSKICLIRIEDNVSLVKQVYPMSTGQTWNINRYDTLPQKTNTLLSFDKQDTLNGKIYDKVAQTVQADFSSFYQKQYETEKYARGIGLIYKQLIDIESQSLDQNHPVNITKPIMSRVTSGTITTWQIYSYK